MKTEDRFWAKVKKSDGCWEWTAARSSSGYGVFGVTPTDTRSAHRYAYEMAYGPIAPGLFVLHSCDNPPCVRLDHLSLGTQKDNMADAAAKNRTAGGDGHGRRKLTSEKAAEIRRRYATGSERMDKLAQAFGVSSATVSLIVRGLHWSRVTGPRVQRHAFSGRTVSAYDEVQGADPYTVDLAQRTK